jgi:hypothetical protein
MWVEVSITLSDGQTLTTRCDGPKGFWGLPALEREEHLVKVRSCLQTRLSQADTAHCIQLVEALETLDAEAVQELAAFVGCMRA